MKRIGLIGGMSNKSTILYYDLINEEVNSILGEHYTAEIILLSLNFNEVVQLMYHRQWSKLAKILIKSAQDLVGAGADIIAICCNSAHKVANFVESSIDVPLVHILDSTAKKIQKDKVDKVGLLGNVFTMEDGFYQDYLKSHYGVDCIIPQQTDRNYIHRVIYDEFCYGITTDETRINFQKIISRLQKRGAKGIILGCTEIPMLIRDFDFGIKVFNTTKLHALDLVRYAMLHSRHGLSDRETKYAEEKRFF